MNTKTPNRLKKEKQTPSTMKAFKSLLRRVCEIPYPVAQLRISAPDTLVYELIEEFEERGQTPDFGSEAVL
jgi:hypothetical protein